jgi:hypothetical protein
MKLSKLIFYKITLFDSSLRELLRNKVNPHVLAKSNLDRGWMQIEYKVEKDIFQIKPIIHTKMGEYNFG